MGPHDEAQPLLLRPGSPEHGFRMPFNAARQALQAVEDAKGLRIKCGPSSTTLATAASTLDRSIRNGMAAMPPVVREFSVAVKA